MWKYITAVIVIALIAALGMWWYMAPQGFEIGESYFNETNEVESTPQEKVVSRNEIISGLTAVPGITEYMLERGFFYYMLPQSEEVDGYIMAVQLDEMMSKDLTQGQLDWFIREIALGLVVDQVIPDEFHKDPNKVIEFLEDENTQFVNTDLFAHKLEMLQQQENHEQRKLYVTETLKSKDIDPRESVAYHSFLGNWDELEEVARELCINNTDYCQKNTVEISITSNQSNEQLAFNTYNRPDMAISNGVIAVEAYPYEYINIEVLNQAGTKTAGVISVLSVGEVDGSPQKDSIKVDLFNR